jgi:hypothetical protein
MYKRSLMQDVMSTCNGDGLCYIRNDSPFPFQGTVNVTSVDLVSAATANLHTSSITMPAGAGVIQYYHIDLSSLDTTRTMFIVDVTNASTGAIASRNELALVLPSKTVLSPATVTVTVASTSPPTVTVVSDRVAAYVVLTTQAAGRFEDNAFLMLPGTRVSYPRELSHRLHLNVAWVLGCWLCALCWLQPRCLELHHKS